MVCVLPRRCHFHGVLDRAHDSLRNRLSGGVSRSRRGGVHGLRGGPSGQRDLEGDAVGHGDQRGFRWTGVFLADGRDLRVAVAEVDRKSTRLNSSHGYISYAVFCLKKKKNNNLV